MAGKRYSVDIQACMQCPTREVCSVFHSWRVGEVAGNPDTEILSGCELPDA